MYATKNCKIILAKINNYQIILGKIHQDQTNYGKTNFIKATYILY